MQRIKGFARLTGNTLDDTFGKVKNPWPEESKADEDDASFRSRGLSSPIATPMVNTVKTVRHRTKTYGYEIITSPAGDWKTFKRFLSGESCHRPKNLIPPAPAAAASCNGSRRTPRSNLHSRSQPRRGWEKYRQECRVQSGHWDR